MEKVLDKDMWFIIPYYQERKKAHSDKSSIFLDKLLYCKMTKNPPPTFLHFWELRLFIYQLSLERRINSTSKGPKAFQFQIFKYHQTEST